MGLKVVTYSRVSGKAGALYVDVDGFDGNPIVGQGENGYRAFKYRGGKGLPAASVAAVNQLSNSLGFHVCDVDIRETQYGREKGVELASLRYIGPMSDFTHNEAGELVQKPAKVASPSAVAKA